MTAQSRSSLLSHLASLVNRSRAKHRRAIVEIVRLLSSALEIDEILRIIHEQVGSRFENSSFYVALYDEQRQQWETALDILHGVQQPVARYDVGQGLTGYILRHRRRLHFRSPAELARFLEQEEISQLGELSKSWMGIPMLAADRVVGAIGVENYERTRAFSQRDEEVVATIANYAAVAIGNARLYEENQRRSAELDALFNVGKLIISIPDAQRVLDTICREIVRLLNATSAYVTDLDVERESSTVIAEFYGPEASERERISDLGESYRETPEQIEKMRQGQPYEVRLSNPQLLPYQRQYLEEYDGKSSLVLPLTVRGHILGSIEVWESRYDRAFSPSEIRLGQNLADQAAIAIENARLLQSARETAQELTSALASILTATSQQSAASSRQFMAISAASETIDQVQAIAKETAQRAQAVADTARRTAQVSQAGQQAVADTIRGMERIKQQVESIANGILDLSEQTQTIQQIITTVNEIAAQSNILALNAAVEAARAGKAGKGFAVVAQEVRSLAEQSRAATERVREILFEIRRRANVAASTTEQGMEETDDGVRLADQAGQALRDLAASIEESTTAALQIANAAERQMSGIDEIGTAMDKIQQATAQTVTGAQQSEESATELSQLAERLRVLVDPTRH